MSISFTLFSNIYDNTTSKRVDFDSFDSFENALSTISTKPGYKLKKGERVQKGMKLTELISPALYREQTTRANANVIEFGGFAMLDVDDHRSGDGESLEYELCSTFPNTMFVCYSTSSSTFDFPKFRLLFPLSRWVQYNQLMHLIYAINQKFGDMSDPQTKDISRMYYLPAQYPDSHQFYFRYNGNGQHLNVDELLEEYLYKPPRSKSSLDSLHPALVNHILKSRQQRLSEQSKEYTWTSYDDCPFVNQDLINEYKAIAFTDGAGRYHKIYQIMSSIASNAIRKKYNISVYEITQMIRQLDRDTSNIYGKRKIETEAARAITYAYKNTYY